MKPVLFGVDAVVRGARQKKPALRAALCAGLSAVAILGVAVSSAQATPQYRVLYAFRGGKDGAGEKSLVLGPDGNFYGTAHEGGHGCDGDGCGSVFRLTPSGEFSTLYEFRSRGDGFAPFGPLTFDKSGNLYGVTSHGYPETCSRTSCGTVFKIAPNGTLTTLHSFAGGTDGAVPKDGLYLDKKGDIFGATYFGGASNYGTIFKTDQSGRETVLYAFTGGTDGYGPNGSLIADAAGNLYGTTIFGGEGNGNGTVFKLAPDGTKTLLHAFQDTNDGILPQAGLIADHAGNLYGTTLYGSGVVCEPGCGTVFEITKSGSEKILHFFAGGADGSGPNQIVFADSAGDFYGTTATGGVKQPPHGGYGGTIFSLAADGTKTTLYDLRRRQDGSAPQALVKDDAGNLYGVTYGDGPHHSGTIFELTP